MSSPDSLRDALLELLAEDTAHYPHFLEERFPHVLQRLIALRGKPELGKYLQGLLAPAHGASAGFPEQALAEIRAIQAICCRPPHPRGFSPEEMRDAREILADLLDIDDETYPKALEKRFPDTLRKILSQLEGPGIETCLDSLLTPERQIAEGFSEQALLEIMTLKAALHSRRPGDAPRHAHKHWQETPPAAGNSPLSDDEHTASLVFDRVQRW